MLPGKIRGSLTNMQRIASPPPLTLTLPYPRRLCIRTFVLPEPGQSCLCQSCLSAIGITKSAMCKWKFHTQFPLLALVIKLTIHHHTSSSACRGNIYKFLSFFLLLYAVFSKFGSGAFYISSVIEVF